MFLKVIKYIYKNWHVYFKSTGNYITSIIYIKINHEKLFIYFFLHVLDTPCYGFKANKSYNYMRLCKLQNMACFKNKIETNNIILRTSRTKKNNNNTECNNISKLFSIKYVLIITWLV